MFFLRNRRENRTRVLPRYRTYEAHILGITFAIFAAGVMPFLWKYETTFFLAGELLRFLCVFGLLIVPAILMGLSFPLLLNLYSRGSHQVGRRIGVFMLSTRPEPYWDRLPPAFFFSLALVRFLHCEAQE